MWADMFTQGQMANFFDWALIVASVVGAAVAVHQLVLAVYEAWAGKVQRVTMQLKRVASVDEVAPGEMKEFRVGEKAKVLLVRTKKDGKFHAMGPKCTHYGAPLAKGVLHGDSVTCPWHAACFNVRTGAIEDGPVLDAVPRYECVVEGRDVYVRVPDPLPSRQAATPPMCKEAGDNRTFIIVGGGPAGAAAAESLRASGFGGRILMLTAELDAPYDRIKLSKNMRAGPADLCLRGAAFYERHAIQVEKGVRVTRVDAAAKRVYMATRAGKEVDVPYDKLLLATGARCRTFKPPEGFTIPGAALRNVFTIRETEDAAGIAAAAGPASRVVVVGSSFIGMEAAAYLKAQLKVASVTVIGMEAVPFERVLGREVGAVMEQVHRERGIEFVLPGVVQEFIDDGSGAVCAVQLKGGPRLEADLVVVGAGVIPNTEFLAGSGIEVQPRGAVAVDEHMQVQGAKDVYAAGDIAQFRYWRTGADIRVEHWDVAMDQGRVAGRNMAGRAAPYRTVPFFWTSQFSTQVRYAGNAMRFDRVVIEGDLDARKFVAYYVVDADDAVHAVVSVGIDPVAAAAQALMRADRLPKASALEGKGPTHLLDLVRDSDL